MGRDTTLRAVFLLAVLGACGVAAQAAVGCNDDPLIQVPPCRPGLCTCEEDPSQATCRGFNDRPEGGIDPADASRVETSVEDSSVDAPVDGPDDAADAAD